MGVYHNRDSSVWERARGLAVTHLTRRLLVASHNKGKVREYADILGDLGIDWLTLDEAGVARDVAETEDTFHGNAVLKATAYARQTGLLTLAYDSGLTVAPLGLAAPPNLAAWLP